MYSSFFKFFIISIIILLFISTFTISIYDENIVITDTDETVFFWPLPNNKRITSNFGKRNSPTAGASSNHSGIDIAATEGTNIYSCFSGTVTFTGFKGAGGYTITVQNSNISASYCHVSPIFLYSTGDFIAKANIIANVGPKNVYGVLNNPYKDSKGNPTNGATTGCHLHLTIKKDGIAVNPLNYF